MARKKVEPQAKPLTASDLIDDTLYSVRVLKTFRRGANALYTPQHTNVHLRGRVAREQLEAGTIEVLGERTK